MKVAIIGSRGYPRLTDVDAYVAALPPDSVVISGGARGVDRRAVYAAKRRGLDTKEFMPDYSIPDNGRYALRNRFIVAECDRLVAFWDGESRGTAMTVGFARKAGKPVEIMRPPPAPPPEGNAP